MADWPRSIKPEDRIRYLVQARQDVTSDIAWVGDRDGESHGKTSRGELLSILPYGANFDAIYSVDDDLPIEEGLVLGSFGNWGEAKRVLVDHTVVAWAVTQAWEDVGG